MLFYFFFFFSSRRRHTRCSRDWSSDVCSSDLRDLERGEAGVDVLEAPNPQATVDAPALDLERGVARGGPGGLEPQRDGAVVDAHIAEQDQRGGAMGAGGGAAGVRGPPAQPQQLLDVQPPARVLHDVDHRLPQLELEQHHPPGCEVERIVAHVGARQDRKSTRLNSSHGYISYAVFCLKKKKIDRTTSFNRIITSS